jgi:hypothetical protein
MTTVNLQRLSTHLEQGLIQLNQQKPVDDQSTLKQTSTLNPRPNSDQYILDHHPSTDNDTPMNQLILEHSIHLLSIDYLMIINFLSTILNLDNSDLLQVGTPVTHIDDGFHFGNKYLELLPNIKVPENIWLEDDIIIKDVKIKSSILLEILSWLNHEIASDHELNLANLSHFEKLLLAYNIYDLKHEKINDDTISINLTQNLPSLSNAVSSHTSTSNLESNSISTPASTSSASGSFSSPNPSFTTNLALNSASTPNLVSNSSISITNSTTSKTPRRISSLSREILSSRRRFSNFLNHEKSSDLPISIPTSPTEEDHQKQALNSLLSKSKIYNKLAKRRESQASLNSNFSNRNSTQTNFLAMTMNSISTTNSKRRTSSSFLPGDVIPELNPTNHLTPILSPEQKKENRKLKFEYYFQLYNFLQITEVISKALQQNDSKYLKLRKCLDFLKSKIFKFVVIDTYKMIMDYTALKVYEWN